MNAPDNQLAVPAEAVVSRLTAQIGQLYGELAVAQAALDQAHANLAELYQQLQDKDAMEESGK